MHRRLGHSCTGRHVIHVILFCRWSLLWASATLCELETLDFRNTIFVQAFLHEFVFAPWTIFPVFLAVIRVAPAQAHFAVFKLSHEDCECFQVCDLNVSKHTRLNPGAIFKVVPLFCLNSFELGLVIEEIAEALWQKNCLRIHLDGPIVVLVVAVVSQCLPDLVEQWCVHILVWFILSRESTELALDIWQFCNALLVGIIQTEVAVTERFPTLARENTSFELELGLHQIQLLIRLQVWPQVQDSN